MNQIILSDNLEYLKTIPDGYIDFCYTDVPFNTKKHQKRNKIKTKISETGLVGFGGNKYERQNDGEYGSYNDNFDDYINFLRLRIIEIYRILKNTGSFYLHIDYRECAYVKVMIDQIFGRDNFLSELIWSFDYGGISRNKWTNKHNNILFYVKDKNNYTFNFNAIPRIPYLSPGLVGKEKAERGKIVKSVFWHTIVGTNSKEKQGYTSQKPIAILKPLIEVSSNPGDIVLDPFAGSGSLGIAAEELNRRFIMIDNNPQAFEIMKKRFKDRADYKISDKLF